LKEVAVGVEGFLIGHEQDFNAMTGVTVIIPPEGSVGCAMILGSASSTRQFDSLLSNHAVSRVDALIFTGGSAFGLEVSSGVMTRLVSKQRGLPTPYGIVPICPIAAIFDLSIGDPTGRPSSDMAARAFDSASKQTPLGSVGAGAGATIGKLLGIACAMKGGFGWASMKIPDGSSVGVGVVVNAYGDVVDPTSDKIIAGARDPQNPHQLLNASKHLMKGKDRPKAAYENTVLACVATDADLNRDMAFLVARMASAGLARAINPCHSPFDGDILAVLSSGKKSADPLVVGSAASHLLSMAIVEAIKNADGIGFVPDFKSIGNLST